MCIIQIVAVNPIHDIGAAVLIARLAAKLHSSQFNFWIFIIGSIKIKLVSIVILFKKCKVVSEIFNSLKVHKTLN